MKLMLPFIGYSMDRVIAHEASSGLVQIPSIRYLSYWFWDFLLLSLKCNSPY